MKSERQRQVGPRFTQARDHVEVIGAGVAAVHGREDAVGARLHRQMQLRHQRRQIAMRRDQVVAHVERMAGRIAQPLDAADLREPFEQPRQRPRPPVRSGAMIGIDVLSDQRDFAHAGVRQPLDFGADLVDRAGGFRAARIGHDAERAELVAAFLHGDEGGDAARAGGGGARRGEMIELVVDAEIRYRPRGRRARRARADRAGDDSSAIRPRDRPPARGG